MRTLGLIGGMSWESTSAYYRIINQETRRRLGGSHSARMVMTSADFAEVSAIQPDWDASEQMMIDFGRRLAAAGAESIVICTNTMHRHAEAVEATVGLPLIHIADATASAIDATGIETVALLGTRYTMEQDFYRGRLAASHGLDVRTPDEAARGRVHEIIYGELVRGIIRDESRKEMLAIIDALLGAGAEGVIAGCTEIELLVRADDLDVPYFPTTTIHAHAAVDWALEGAGLE